MKSSRRKKVNYFKLGLCLLIIIVIIGIIIFSIYKLTINHDSKDDNLMINIVNRDVNSIRSEIDKLGIDVTYEYVYNSEFEKDRIISQSISEGTVINKGDKLTITVSRGIIDKDKLREDGINELGKVPIMMYHGIKDMKNSETNYTGGNVDKDGYTRTAEAFRNDLEGYYQKGYRMIRLSDYIEGKIDVDYGYSPIILTFDDGNDNNIKVTGLDDDGNIIIDKNSAVGILEEFKKKYPDYNVTAIFFVTNALFNQPEYDEAILKWLVDNGYEVGNHTKGHDNFTKIDSTKTQETVGFMYNKLEEIMGNKYSKIVALPFGSPYNKTHENYKYILNGEYNGKSYQTVAALRVGWEAEISPFNKDFDKTFLKRCRAYDNNGVDFDIEMNFRLLEKTRYISDGDNMTIVTSSSNENLINKDTDKEVILY